MLTNLSKVILAILFLLFLAVLMGFPTMYLWNWLMPKTFHLSTITLTEAIGINFLTTILFKNSGSNNSSK